METLARRCSDEISERFGIVIPWDVLVPIIVDIITQCFETEAAFVAACQCPTMFQTLVLRQQAIRRLRGRFYGLALRRAANATTDVLLEKASITPADKLGAVYREVA